MIEGGQNVCQNAEIFQREIDNHQFAIKLFENCVEIVVTSTMSLEQYFLSIDQQQLTSNSIHQLLFQTPQSLYYVICQKITENQLKFYQGNIQFNIKTIMAKDKTVIHKILFPMIKKQASELDILKANYKKLQIGHEALSKSNAITQNKLKQLQKDLASLIKEKDYIKMRYMKERQLNEELKADLMKHAQLKRRADQKCERFKEHLEQSQLLRKTTQSDLKTMKLKRSSLSPNFFSAERESLEEAFQRVNKRSFKINQLDYHFRYFQVKENIVTKTSTKHNMANLFGKKIESDSISSFRVRQMSEFDNIYYGIGSSSISGSPQAHSSPYFIGCHSNGFSWRRQTCAIYSGQNKVGGVVKVQINTKDWIIEWFAEEIKVWECKIPAQMQQITLFQVIIMSIGSAIEILQ